MKLPDISQWVWEEKYRLKRPDGQIVDQTMDDTWRRVSSALAEPEPPESREKFRSDLHEAMASMRFMPAGRIVAGAGSGRDVTLMNCYVMGRIVDSLAGIHDALKESALTLKTGGGIGMDFSTLRPRGAPVKGVESTSSGAVSFMDSWDAMCRTIMSAGARRGAMMGVLRCDHPDIEEFIRAKSERGRLTNFNMSVAVTSKFMRAIEEDAQWPLSFGGRVYKTVSARELWQSILRATYERAEPGVAFIDRMNWENPLLQREYLYATNPCVSGDTWLLTSDGDRPIKSLVGKSVKVWNGFEWSMVEPKVTGENQTLFRVVLSGGRFLDCTSAHVFILADGSRAPLNSLSISTVIFSGSRPPQGDGSDLHEDNRYQSIVKIEELPGVHTVYCVTEPKRHMATFNGIVTGNCGEQPLPPYGACCLGSINLARMVTGEFTPQAEWDVSAIREATALGIRALDNAITISHYPLQQQREEAMAKRRVGLGVTGLADALIMLGVRYGSPQAREVTGNVMRFIRESAEEETERLGRDRGSFPLFDRQTFEFHTPTEISDFRRNSHVLSIAPTGTISLLMGNVSGGIEPVFAWEAERKVLRPDGSRQSMVVRDYALQQWLDRHPGSKGFGSSPEAVTAADLSTREHIDMVAAVQPYVDSAISKTINCPADMTFEEFGEVYQYAYDRGLKGCTTYRPNEVTGAVLTSMDGKAATPPAETDAKVVSIADRMERPDVLDGKTYKIKPAEHAYYITINDAIVGGRRVPFELFIASKEAASYAWRVALSRMVSANLRRGGDVSFVHDELRQVFDPHGGFWKDGRYVPSLPAAIGEVLARHMGAMDGGEDKASPRSMVRGSLLHCPRCQHGRLIVSEGCQSCDSCSYTKCG